MSDGPIRIDLTPEERAIFGTCPVCKAKPGQKCTGEKPHTERISKAPKYRIVTFHN